VKRLVSVAWAIFGIIALSIGVQMMISLRAKAPFPNRFWTA
jgi:hypothetical protein